MNEIFSRQETLDHLLKIPGVNPERLNCWLSTPPRFTILRFDPRKQDKKELEREIDEFLVQQYAEKKAPRPNIIAQTVLPDILVLESGGPQDVRPPAEDEEVMVGALCACAVLRGADVFAPGVLGLAHSARRGDRVALYADVDGKCLRGHARKTFDGGRKKYIGNGVLLKDRGDLFKREGSDNVPASGVAVRVDEATFDCPSLEMFTKEGKVTLQNLPSVLCSHVLAPVPGDLVLDMCAAPGGKTTHLAAMVQSSSSSRPGQVIALDKSKNKMSQIEANCERLGLGNVTYFPFDATRCVRTDTASSASAIGQEPPFVPNSFDKILLDAPCSSLGQRPQLANNIRMTELMSFPKLQKKLLANAVDLLKPGGTLVYSTCSFTLGENEELVAWALKSFGHRIRLVEALPRLGQDGILVEGLTQEDCGKVQRFFLSNHKEREAFCTDTIGFFIAKFMKMRLKIYPTQSYL